MITKDRREIISYICILVMSFLLFFAMNDSFVGTGLLAAMTVVLIVCNYNKKTIYPVVPIILLCGYFIIMFALSGTMGITGFNSPQKFVAKFIGMMFAFVAATVIKQFSEEEKKRIVQVCILSIIISSFISIYYCIFVDPMAMRARDLVDINATFSFGQLYAIVLFIGGFSCYWLTMTKKNRIWSLVVFVILFTCLAYAMFTTALLLAIIGIVLGLILNNLTNKKRVAISIIALIAILIVFLVVREPLSAALYRMTLNFPELVQQRVAKVIDLLFATSHETTYTMDRRFELASYSLNSFFQHPWFGVGIKGIKYGAIGYHQEWPDMLGICGIIGTAIISLVMSAFTRKMFSWTEQISDKKALAIGLVQFFILGFLNPCISAASMFMLFCILPNLSSLGYGRAE